MLTTYSATKPAISFSCKHGAPISFRETVYESITFDKSNEFFLSIIVAFCYRKDFITIPNAPFFIEPSMFLERIHCLPLRVRWLYIW